MFNRFSIGVPWQVTIAAYLGAPFRDDDRKITPSVVTRSFCRIMLDLLDKCKRAAG